MIRLFNRAKLFKTRLRYFSNAESNEKTSEQNSEQKEDDEEIWDEDDESYEEEETSIFKRLLKWGLFSFTGYLFYINGTYANKNGFDEDLASGETFYVKPFYKTSAFFIEKANEGYNYLRYPPIRKFLPDEIPIHPNLLRKTLVLNFEGTLYSKDMKTGEGIMIHLRPGFRQFIKDMSPKYEIVLFAKEETSFMNDVIQTIDPVEKYFPWFFGNEFLSTYPNGLYKDLKFMNRNLKRVVVVDFENDKYLNNNNNVIHLDKYDGARDDQGLKNLKFFLDHLANQKVKDVRREIKRYGGFNSPDNYKQKLDEKYQQMKKNRSFFLKNKVASVDEKNTNSFF